MLCVNGLTLLASAKVVRAFHFIIGAKPSHVAWASMR